jgi:hypothetical protein
MAVRPRGGAKSTSQGRPYAIFRRALEHGNLLVAEATAKELPPLSLEDALELTVLIAPKDRLRHPRVSARWLLRYHEAVTRRGSTKLRRSRPASPFWPETAMEKWR